MCTNIIFDILSVAIVSAAVIIAYLQIGKSISTAVADHERRKKQSTIEFFFRLSELTREPLLLMKEYEKTGSLDIEKMDQDEKLTGLVDDYLSNMECFAVGVNSGVYDLNTYNVIAGRVAIKRYNILSAWIDKLRKNNSNDKMFNEYETMIKNLEKLRGTPITQTDKLYQPKLL